MQEIIYEDFRDWNCILRIILYQKNQYFPSTCLNKLNKYILSFINLTFANDESQRWFTNSNIVHPITLFPLKEVGVSLLIAILSAGGPSISRDSPHGWRENISLSILFSPRSSYEFQSFVKSTLRMFRVAFCNWTWRIAEHLLCTLWRKC